MSARNHGARSGSRRILRWMGLIGGLVMLACWPVTTRVGVNYVTSSQRITLAEKTLQFLSRDLQARRLAHDAVAQARTDAEKLEAIFAWVRQRIKPVPEGLAVIDDHVLHVIIRGYGADDQRAEVLTLLASYAGLRAGMVLLRPPEGGPALPLALVRVDGRTVACDVANGLLFRNAQGRLASVEELRAHPEWVERTVGARRIGGRSYVSYLQQLKTPQEFWARMDAQKPWPRMWQELVRMLHLGQVA